MALLSKPLDEEVVDLTWFCLQQPVHQNGLFKQHFFDLDILAEIASEAGLSYCPRLSEALSGDKPPDLSFFESLHTDFDQRWAIYAIILKKSDSMILIYNGSATSSPRRGLPMVDSSSIAMSAIPASFTNAIWTGTIRASVTERRRQKPSRALARPRPESRLSILVYSDFRSFLALLLPQDDPY